MIEWLVIWIRQEIWFKALNHPIETVYEAIINIKNLSLVFRSNHEELQINS
jgi:hypothetical protein